MLRAPSLQDALCSYHSNAGCFELLFCRMPRGSSCVQVAKSCLQPFLLLMLHLLRLFGSCLQVGSCRFFCASESDFKNKRNDSSKCGWAHVTDMCRAWDLFCFTCVMHSWNPQLTSWRLKTLIAAAYQGGPTGNICDTGKLGIQQCPQTYTSALDSLPLTPATLCFWCQTALLWPCVSKESLQV